MRPPCENIRQAVAALALAGLLLVVAVTAARAAETVESLTARCQEVRLQLAAEKARVLREDTEAIALREQIERLYRDLDRIVSAKPAVARLQRDLDRLEEAAKAQEAAAPATRTAGGRKP